MYFVCHKKGHLKAPSKCPKLLGQMLTQCWNFNPDRRPTFHTMLNVISREVFSKPSRRHDYLELIQ